MAKAPQHKGRAISGLAKWVDRDRWREPLRAVLDEHVEAILDEEGMGAEELIEVLGTETFAGIWMAAFEDFVTRDLDDGENAIDDYLKRRSWKESPGNRDYLKALRQAVMSLYDVLEVVPGQGMTLADRLRGGEPLAVSDQAASRAVAPGDVIATRVLPVRGTLRLGGTVLDLAPPAVAAIEEHLAALQDMAGEVAPELLAELEEAPDPELTEAITDLDTLLGASAPLFSEHWLRQALDEIWDGPGPRLVDGDGETFKICEADYPMAEGIEPEAVAAGLDQVSALRRSPESAVALQWQWRADEPSIETAADRQADAAAGLVRIAERDESGRLLLGSVEILDGRVTLRTSSPVRLERGCDMLEAALGELVGPPTLVERSAGETAETVMALLEREALRDEDGSPDGNSGTRH